MDRIKYYCERSYPYIIALLLTKGICLLKIDILTDKNLNELLSGIITIDSIIIGFLGALLPIITSVRTESEFVKYVFEKDKKSLFTKYIKETIQFGLASAGVTLILYLRESIKEELAKNVVLFSWFFVTVGFLLLTYRCMRYIIDLLLYKYIDNIENNNAKKSEEDLEFQEKHKKDF